MKCWRIRESWMKPSTGSGLGGRGTQSAAVQVMAMYERAERSRQPITGIFLDIKKAYDSVVRGAGKAMALRRLGVDEGTVEFFVHVDRGNINWVRTGWEKKKKKKKKLYTAGLAY